MTGNGATSYPVTGYAVSCTEPFGFHQPSVPVNHCLLSLHLATISEVNDGL